MLRTRQERTNPGKLSSHPHVHIGTHTQHMKLIQLGKKCKRNYLERGSQCWSLVYPRIAARAQVDGPYTENTAQSGLSSLGDTDKWFRDELTLNILCFKLYFITKEYIFFL